MIRARKAYDTDAKEADADADDALYNEDQLEDNQDVVVGGGGAAGAAGAADPAEAADAVAMEVEDGGDGEQPMRLWESMGQRMRWRSAAQRAVTPAVVLAALTVLQYNAYECGLLVASSGAPAAFKSKRAANKMQLAKVCLCGARGSGSGSHSPCL